MSDHITSTPAGANRQFDPATLTPTQLDGIACVTCGAEDGPMKPVAIVPGHGQVFACSGRESVPATVQERAEKAGREATQRYLMQYGAEMEAHEATRAERAAGTAPTAAWLAEDPCPAWCVGDLDHDDSTHPDDRNHWSPTHSVDLVTMEPVVMGGPTAWAPDRVNFALEQGYREREPRVLIGKGDDTIIWATLAEAEEAAVALLDLVRKARGLAAPPVMPFDPDGRCSDKSCRHCYGQSDVSA